MNELILLENEKWYKTCDSLLFDGHTTKRGKLHLTDKRLSFYKNRKWKFYLEPSYLLEKTNVNVDVMISDVVNITRVIKNGNFRVMQVLTKNGEEYYFTVDNFDLWRKKIKDIVKIESAAMC